VKAPTEAEPMEAESLPVVPEKVWMTVETTKAQRQPLVFAKAAVEGV
jgi:hypothetical protein